MQRSLVLGIAAAACGPAQPPPPSVVLITLDTTRADHLSCFGYERQTSPNLDLLAREGLLFERAYSTSSWTLPAHASLFTGKFPRSHGARYDAEGPLVITNAIDGPAYWDRYRARSIAPDEKTLAGLLKGHGYATGAVVAGPWLKRVFGLDAGFDHYDDDGIRETNGRPAAEVTQAASRWLDELEPGAPFLLFVNYYDAHFPLEPPAGFRERFAPPGRRISELSEDVAMLALYDAEIRYMDHHLGLLFQHLKELGVWDDSWVVVTADHGELLGERGRIGHGRYLTQSEIHIPLIVKPPAADASFAVGRSAAPVQITDVLPFLLGELGFPVPEGVQGQHLGEVTHPIVAEVHPLEIMSGEGDWEAIVKGDLKLAKSSLGVTELHDVARDPAEGVNLAGRDPRTAATMETTLARFLSSLPPPGAAGPERMVDGETARTLQSLGYGGKPH